MPLPGSRRTGRTVKAPEAGLSPPDEHGLAGREYIKDSDARLQGTCKLFFIQNSTDMSGTYPITGISAGRGSAGQLPIRRDVDEWWLSNNPNDINQHSLMIQAMNIFEDMDVTTKLSYFQIAGIHGLPLVPWDEDTKPVVPDTGYCTHGSILFPSWHRPYMLLVEVCP